MKPISLSAFALCVSFLSLTSIRAADVWGKPPEASDDRFSNPKSTLYAGPDGWYNTGEVRAVIGNAAKTPVQYKANFQQIMGNYDAVKDLQVLHMDFGSSERPAPGIYMIGEAGSLEQKAVKFSFSDVANGKILEWSSSKGAGTLEVKNVNGFTYFTCRNVTLKPSGLSHSGETDKPLTLGFEGALSPE